MVVVVGVVVSGVEEGASSLGLYWYMCGGGVSQRVVCLTGRESMYKAVSVTVNRSGHGKKLCSSHRNSMAKGPEGGTNRGASSTRSSLQIDCEPPANSEGARDLPDAVKNAEVAVHMSNEQ
jgi:hypothetical protein